MVLEDGSSPDASFRIESSEGEAPNSFQAFIAANAGDFTSYADLMHDYREGMGAFRGLFSNLEADMAKQVHANRAHQRLMVGAMRDTKQRLFNGASGGGFLYKSAINANDLNIGGVASFATPKSLIVREQLQAMIDTFAGIVNPQIESINETTSRLLAALDAHLSSGYKAVVDTSEYLDSLKDGNEKALIAPFFRDFITEDDKEKKQGRTGYFGSPREVLQANTGELNNDVFQRYWESMEQGKSPDVYEWAVFIAKVAMYSRDESRVTGPNAEDVRHAIARVPIGQWPRMLREGYSAFARQDVANLFRNIRDRMVELFPQVSQKSYEAPEKDVDPEEGKRRRNGDGTVVYSSSSAPAAEAPVGLEDARKTYSLGVIQRNPDSNQSRTQFIRVEPENLDEMIRELASAGKTPQMQEDFAAIIRALVENPDIPGSKKLVGKHLSIDRVNVPWRRFDPRAIRGLRLTDRNTAQYRITYIVNEREGILVFRHFVPHNVFDNLKPKDFN